MISNILLYAANRATHGAVENVTRRASWGGFAVFLLLVGTAFSLAVAFWVLSERYDPTRAGIIIAAACFVVGFLCLLMPQYLDRLEARSKAKTLLTPAQETVSAVQEEVAEAVDYFGPIRVIGSAFVLGLSIARSLKR